MFNSSPDGSMSRSVIYTIEETPVEGILPAEIQTNVQCIEQVMPSAPKFLLSNVVSIATNRVTNRVDNQRSCDSLYCESCHNRLQKLDELDLKQAELEMMVQIYQKKVELSKRLLDEYHAKEKPFLENIGKIFNGDQIVRILTGHCQKRRGGSSWDDGTMKKAAKLYFLCSPQGYQEIISLKMPFPSSHTLQNVIQKGRAQPLNPKTTFFDPFATHDVSLSISAARRNMQKQKQLLASRNQQEAAAAAAGAEGIVETKVERTNYAERINRLTEANESFFAETNNISLDPEEEPLLEEEQMEQPSIITEIEEDLLEPIPPRNVGLDRAVGAVVRSVVDQVVRTTTITKPRGPYVSILRNPNDPNAPAKYNLIMPRHMLKPGQRFVLKHPSPGQSTSTVQIISQRSIDATTGLSLDDCKRPRLSFQ